VPSWISARCRPQPGLDLLADRVQGEPEHLVLIRFLGCVYAATAGWAGVDVLDTAREVFDDVAPPDLPGQAGRGGPEAGWPPLTMFVATAGRHA
jgi:hypothetical protein